MLNVILGYLFIFFARVTDVSMATVRTLMIVRGRRLQAAIIGFFEVLIYIIALNKVVQSLDNPINLIVYALGFATGNYVGSIIEERMAVGNISAQVISGNNSMEMVEELRKQGYGVTVLEGMGMKGKKMVLNVSLKRRDLPKLLDIINDIDAESFVTVMDARTTKGGYFKRRHKAK